MARAVNRAMVSPERPEAWFKCLKNYAQCDLLVGQAGHVSFVFLKKIDGSSRYYVRPGQAMGPLKFRNFRLKQAYRYIKGLKERCAIHDLSLYLVKKILYQESLLMEMYGTASRSVPLVHT